jgi:hypothetical protein
MIGCTILLVGGVALTALTGSESEQTGASPPPVVAAAPAARPLAVATDDTLQGMTPSGLQTDNENQPVEVVAAKPANGLLVDPTVAVPLESQSPENTSTARDEKTATEIARAPSSPAAGSEALSTVHPSGDPTSNDSRRALVLKFDPLDFDPSQLSLAATSATNAGPATSSIPDVQPEDADAPAVAEEATPEGVDELRPPAENPSVTVRLGPVIRDETAAHGTAMSLALHLDSFALANIPLERFLALVSDMAGVPISLDPIAFELSGISPRAAVAVNASNVTLEQLLKDVLSTHRLELAEAGGQVRIALANGDERSTKTHDVTDLLEARGGDARHIAALIERFLSPATWQAAGGPGKIDVNGGKLRVDQSKAVHHEIVVFCERLRLARGLRRRTRYPVDRLSVASPYREIEAQLAERTTFTFLPWTRLADVVSHWEQQSGVMVLVDWSSLADEGLAPSSPIACSAVDRPWSEALDGILEPIGLAWWAVDPTMIQITTQEALAGIQRTEFYSVPKVLHDQYDGREALVGALNKELQERVGADAATVESVETRTNGIRLLVRGNPDVHRYLTSRFKDAGQ